MGAQKSIQAGKAKIDVNVDFSHQLCGTLFPAYLNALRRPSSHWLAQQTFVVQHSVAPEVAVHGMPVDNFSRSGSGGVNLCRFSAGLNLNEPASSAWSSTTSIRYEHVRLLNDDGRCISRDMGGLPVTCR
ncbi:hypothetical protein EJ110_NYTH60000 [Nymphaea thermarum]|nr:hypothetical protein EJ110_NYTH60000 [Nymphaea thermarum]